MLSSKYRVEKNLQYGFLQIVPTPTAEEIAQYYKEEFYSSSYPQLNNSALDVQERDKVYNDSRREDMAKQLEIFLGASLKDKKIFDFGCGFGHTISHLKKFGAQCYGCDPAEEAVAFAKQQGLMVEKLEKMDCVNVFPDIQFDVVILMNVLEHLADPIQTLQEIKQKILKPNGILVIEVPNDFDIFQQCAQQVHNLSEWWVSPPAHLNYFNQKSLSALLIDQGFVIEKTLGTFPLELFLLFGDNYVADQELGRICHKKRVYFEMNMKKHGFSEALDKFYEALGNANLGRQILTYARSV